MSKNSKEFDRDRVQKILHTIFDGAIDTTQLLAPLAESIGAASGHPEVSVAAALAKHIADELEASSKQQPEQSEQAQQESIAIPAPSIEGVKSMGN